MSDACASVQSDRLMAHMREFARRVKLSGTPEELESFRYLQAQLDGFGYRTTLLSHDAYISLPGPARVEVDGTALPCITHSMSRPSGDDGVAAELAYVGEGKPADLAGRDLAGRIWLVDGIATPDVAARARDAGALGEIHVSPTEHRYEMCISPVWGSPSQHTRPALPSTVVCTVSRDDGAKLRERCERGERMTARLWTKVDTGWRKTPLLVADMAADDAPHSTKPDAPFVLFSGHHDTWHYGVMDNGGANATMLEAARILADRRAAWRRGLRLCFWSGHSHGRYSGSAWYADEYWDELDRRCAAHVNVDSTGGSGAVVLTDSAVVSELKAVAADAVRAVSGQAHAGHRPSRSSDMSFWGVGVPSMFGSISHQPPEPVKMRNALGWWWHTPHDLIERIDPDFLVRDTCIVLLALERLLQSDVLPLDYVATADALAAELLALQTALGDRLDIDALSAATAALRTRAQTARDAARTAGPEQARALDRALMHASRALVPLNHTSGDRFRHDPALPLNPFPPLDGLRELAREPADSPDLPFFVVHARQARNRILQALRTATMALESAS